MTDPSPSPRASACSHPHYDDGACTQCGHLCEHDLVLNSACYYCGTQDLDGLALSNKPRDQIIPASRLTRGPK